MGAEVALKHEVARTHPGLKFAYSRPGFVTFKSDGSFKLTPEFSPGWVFARAWGLSLGKAPEAELAALVLRSGRAIAETANPVRLHVFERDQYAPGDEPELYFPGQLASEALSKIMAEPGAAAQLAPGAARVGELVLDIIWVNPEEWWIGYHRQGSLRLADAGCISTDSLPSHAPSRAYLKLKEVAAWAQIPFKKGQTALEVGSAPGGAVTALLEMGLNVIGVDPAEMDARVMSNPAFRHIARSIADLDRGDFPEQVEWLVVDMNAEPRVAVAFTERVARTLGSSLHGLVFTLKLNQWRLAQEIPNYLARILHWNPPGFVSIRAAQLSNHRQEIAIVALTQRGGGRKNG